MTDCTLVQGDTNPPIRATITDQDGAVVNLTGSTVNFQFRKADDRKYTVNAQATLLDATNGRVQYLLGTNDLAIPGEYQVQWEITFPSGRIQTTAVPNTVTVRRA